ncbi:uncharacterized protein HGUI_03567 [Hanseniaspora guilliermondii]|uniref:IPT/TIG domain-containing protein n=1 Tax=Hanseniaspora guilliermondii TaxID=56406 RepID=A0A1L0FP80_9ASCO|nr:uncharacterized protein HGUI_03567 [Hanseniaspora guilliermondii]
MNSDFNTDQFLQSEEPLNINHNKDKNKKSDKNEDFDNFSSLMNFIDFDNVDFQLPNTNIGQDMKSTNSMQRIVFEQLMTKNSSNSSNHLNDGANMDFDFSLIEKQGSNGFENQLQDDESNINKLNSLNNDFNLYMDDIMRVNALKTNTTNPVPVDSFLSEGTQLHKTESKNNNYINELVDVFDDHLNISSEEPVLQQELLKNINTLQANNIYYWKNCLKYVENAKFGKSPDFTRSDFVKEQENIKRTSLLRDSESDEYIKMPEDASMFPYKITVGEIPPTSRVETQVKLNISIEPAPKQNIIHLSTNCIPRRKYMLSEPIDTWDENLLEHVLFLEAHVIKVSDKSPVTPCERCCKREERRFSRRKSGATDADLWAVNDDREALIFNHKQLCVLNQNGANTNPSASEPKVSSNPDSKYITFISRFVCYCRHQKEPVGFEIVFLLKNHKGEIIGKKTSSSIKVVNITQRTKTIKDNASDFSDTASSVASESSYATDYSNSRQSSIDYSESSYQSELDRHSDALMNDRNSRSYKAMNSLSASTQELLQHQGQNSNASNQDINLSSISMNNKLFNSNSPSFRVSPNVPRNASTNNLLMVKNNTQNFMQQQKTESPKPSIFKIIPNSGPTSGAVEVTILGENFTPNTDVVFGYNKALSVNYWGPTTIVAKAPPTPTAGPVQVVSLVDSMYIPESIPSNPEAIFTYVDQNDKQLLELALKIVDINNNKSLNSTQFSTDTALAQDLLMKQQSNGNGSQDSDFKYEAHKVVLSLLNSTTNDSTKNDLNKKNEEGRTLLHLACMKSHIELIIFLVSNSVNVNCVDNYGYTPLHFACLQDDIRVMKMLIAMNCDKFSPTYCNDLSTPLELYLNNFKSKDDCKNYDEVYELLKEDDKKDFRSGSMDQHSAYSNESGFQQHMSTMVSQSSNCLVENHKSDMENERSTDILHLKDTMIGKASRASENESTTSALTVNDSVNSSLESHPPLYDDLYPESVLKKPSEEFEDIQNQKMIDVVVPKLSSHPVQSLLPPIDSLSMKLDLIETTDMEDKIANSLEHRKTKNDNTTDTELYDEHYENDRNGLGMIKNKYKNKMLRLNMFNEDLMNQFKLMKSKQKDFSMDTKLIFFWIPFLLILISTVVVLAFSSSSENSIADSWNMASNKIRTRLANFFLGKQRWQMFVKDAIHQGEIKFKEAFNSENIQSIF